MLTAIVGSIYAISFVACFYYLNIYDHPEVDPRDVKSMPPKNPAIALCFVLIPWVPCVNTAIALDSFALRNNRPFWQLMHQDRLRLEA